MKYSRIGNTVNVTGQINVASVSSPTGTYVQVGNLPFTVADTADASSTPAGSIYLAGLGAAAATALYMNGAEGSALMYIYESDGQAADGGFCAHWSSSTYVTLSMTYRAA